MKQSFQFAILVMVIFVGIMLLYTPKCKQCYGNDWIYQGIPPFGGCKKYKGLFQYERKPLC